MTNAHGVARDQLRAFVERIERLEEEKKTIADDIKDVYGEAKSMGFDTKVLKKLIGLRKKDEQERQEEELILDTYMAALGMIPQMDMFEDDAPKAKSPAMALQSPRKAAEAVSERTATNQPETANEMDREEMRDGKAAHSLAAEKGRKAIPAGPEGVDLNHAGAGEIPATPIAPASHGEAEANSAEREPTGNVASDSIRVAANAGGDHVDPVHSHAATAGTRINHIVPATKPKTARDYRPHCLKPDACGASSLDHCYSCKRAMKAQEEFA